MMRKRYAPSGAVRRDRDDIRAAFAVGRVPSDRDSLGDRTMRTPQIAVIGLGYVGLPTALGLFEGGASVVGIDVSRSRLNNIRNGNPDLLAEDLARLSGALGATDSFVLTTDMRSVRNADAVMICVPTPVDSHFDPDLTMLKAACAGVVEQARPGQLIVLTSTSYPGSARDLLARPLEARNLIPGEDIYVASSPERIDPGNAAFPQRTVPRVVGGITPACSRRAAALIRLLTPDVHIVSSPEAAEMTKLIENSFRAVNIAFANEMADVARSLGLSIGEVIAAASTKPYGFMPFYPGAGVGGHCIPVDPHYLLWLLRANRIEAPVLSEAMASIARRPHEVVIQIAEALSAVGRGLRDARILIVGVAYKPDVRDTRGSPALEILAEIADLGGWVDYHDPLVHSVSLDGRRVLLSVAQPDPSTYDLVLIHTLHRQIEYEWLEHAPLLLDPSGRHHAFTSQPEQHSRTDAAVGEAEVISPIEEDRSTRRVAEESAAFFVKR